MMTSVSITFSVESSIDAGALIAFADMLEQKDITGTEIDTYIGFVWDVISEYFDVLLNSEDCCLNDELKTILRRVYDLTT